MGPRDKASSSIGSKASPSLFLSSSLDWEVRLWKPNFTNFATVAKHEDFISSIDINNSLNPFVFASADSEGNLLVNKILCEGTNRNILKWNADGPIQKVQWSRMGTSLGVLGVGGSV